MPAPKRNHRWRAVRVAAAVVVVALVPVGCSQDERPGPRVGAGTSAASETTQGPVASEDYDQVAAEGFVWGLPLVITRRTMARFGALIGVNQLFGGANLQGPDSRLVVAPNRDTLYSIAVIDLSNGPLRLTLPDFEDRYFTYQFMDAYTESFHYVGTRTGDSAGGTWLIAPEGYDGPAPSGSAIVEVPTTQMFLLGRILVDDEADVANVVKLADGSGLEPYEPGRTAATKLSPGEAPGPPQGAGSEPMEFWDEVAAALERNPPVSERGRAVVARLAQLGVTPGSVPSRDISDPAVRAALEAAPDAGRAQYADEAASAPVTNGWTVRSDVGTYGDNLELRAGVATVGWGANVPEEAMYPVTRVDGVGEPLSGANRYVIHFEADELPDVEAFWSLSVYGSDMFFVQHPSGRYTIGDRTTGLEYGDDGSLDLYLQHNEPVAGAANWLPTPADGFTLMLRLYLPTGEWGEVPLPLPAVQRLGG
ncbi:MAG: DUF1254 domain-containing protein [Microthrixaceae bacterium]